MGQNVLSQSDCSIFKSTIFPEKINEIAWFFTCWYKLTKIKSWSKNLGVDVVRAGYGQPGHRTLKFTVSQEWVAGIYWVLVKIQES